jgi:hypothetical protein
MCFTISDSYKILEEKKLEFNEINFFLDNYLLLVIFLTILNYS